MEKQFYVEFVRIEHNVYRANVIADSEEEAKEIFMKTLDWDDYDTVHAEEYFQTVECGDE